MSSRLPADVDAARRTLHRLAARLGLEPASPDHPDRTSWRGTLSGLPVRVSVHVYDEMGVPLHTVTTTISFEPPLGLGVELEPGDADPEWHAIHHLPPSWRNHAALGRIRRGRSSDPFLTRRVLAEAPPPADIYLDVARIADDALTFIEEGLPSAREVKRHVLEAAEWAARLAVAARDARPADHEVMPKASWRAIARRHGGELDLQAWRYWQELPHGEVSLRLRWDPSRGYSLQGDLSWFPLPLERLELTLEASRSWLRRLFLPDVVVGDAAFDEAFLVDVEEGAVPLEELLTPAVRRGLLSLAARTVGLTVDRGGAAFLVHPVVPDPTELDPVLDACFAVLDGLSAARDPARGAYR